MGACAWSTGRRRSGEALAQDRDVLPGRPGGARTGGPGGAPIGLVPRPGARADRGGAREGHRGPGRAGGLRFQPEAAGGRSERFGDPRNRRPRRGAAL
ncbi:MAG: hypothetical protein FJW34_11010 [Acidobacteria bacterium]|nr:hypothetical protein [Acidobacteriota bacterium]